MIDIENIYIKDTYTKNIYIKTINFIEHLKIYL